VIIPAAGRGNRLRPFTDTVPKALVPVGGEPLLARSLRLLAATGRVSELVLVVGHLEEQIRDAVAALRLPFPQRFIRNPDYLQTNSIVSLALTRELWDDGFVLIDSDVAYEPELLDPLFDDGGDAMLIDSSRGWSEIDMKVTIRDGRVWHLDKALGPGDTQGEFFGMSTFAPAGAALLADEIESMLAAGDTGVWYEYAMRSLARRHPIAPLYTHFGAWCEIDCADDLPPAEAKLARWRTARAGAA